MRYEGTSLITQVNSNMTINMAQGDYYWRTESILRASSRKTAYKVRANSTTLTATSTGDSGTIMY